MTAASHCLHLGDSVVCHVAFVAVGRATPRTRSASRRRWCARARPESDVITQVVQRVVKLRAGQCAHVPQQPRGGAPLYQCRQHIVRLGWEAQLPQRFSDLHEVGFQAGTDRRVDAHLSPHPRRGDGAADGSWTVLPPLEARLGAEGPTSSHPEWPSASALQIVRRADLAVRATTAHQPRLRMPALLTIRLSLPA